MGYIPHTEEDRQSMLKTIGVSSIEELFKDIPEHLQVKGDLAVARRLDEHNIIRELGRIAAKNCSSTEYVNFLGAGIYDHFSPSVVNAIIQRGEFLSAYTPYQPELSQGNLQAIYEFQTMVCELTGMEVANASMYDAGSAAAEAALMAIEITNRSQILVSEAVHPHYRDCVKTYAWASGFKVKEVPAPNGFTSVEDIQSAITDKTACVIVQSPNFFGSVEDLKLLIESAQKAGAISVAAVDPISLGLLKPPGEFGADIVVAEGQSLGWPVGFGGPLLGLFACKQEFVRKIPGRIVGKTTDTEGRRGFVMTLRTREQDIRREKATSNICTNEALLALAATVFMAAVGKHGFKCMAEASLQKAHYAAKQLSQIPGVELRFKERPFFKEFAIKLPGKAGEIRDKLIGDKIIAGLPLGDYYPSLDDSLLIAVTETRSREEIDRLVEAVRKAVS